jgi:hypothetical protein
MHYVSKLKFPSSKLYLNATGFKLGLLVNFGSFPKTQWERIVLSNHPGERDVRHEALF